MRILRFFSFVIAIVVILSVSAFADAPIITAQPQNIYLPAGTEFPYDANFSIMASGDGLSYQWQYSRDSGTTWINTGYGTNHLSVSIGNIQINGGVIYRCIVSGDDGSVISSVVSVSVGAYLLDSIPQMLASGTEVINSIFEWVGSACACIIDTPVLLIGVSLFALGASIAILSRLLSRS